MPLPLGIVIYTTVSLLGGVLLPDQASLEANMLTLDHLQQVWQFDGNKLISCNKECEMQGSICYYRKSRLEKGFRILVFQNRSKCAEI